MIPINFIASHCVKENKNDTEFFVSKAASKHMVSFFALYFLELLLSSKLTYYIFFRTQPYQRFIFVYNL